MIQIGEGGLVAFGRGDTDGSPVEKKVKSIVPTSLSSVPLDYRGGVVKSEFSQVR